MLRKQSIFTWYGNRFGTVTVNNTKTVVFEAGSEIILNPGFEVEQGAIFEANIIDCIPE